MSHTHTQKHTNTHAGTHTHTRTHTHTWNPVGWSGYNKIKLPLLQVLIKQLIYNGSQWGTNVDLNCSVYTLIFLLFNLSRHIRGSWGDSVPGEAAWRHFWGPETQAAWGYNLHCSSEIVCGTIWEAPNWQCFTVSIVLLRVKQLSAI
jgi:hypothetical protein